MIEDDDDARVILAELVSAMGIEVRCACDGAEALRLLDQPDVEAPVLVLSDLLLPGVLGTSIVDYIQQEPRFAATKIALITGSPELAHPGVPVFTKPANVARLKAFISSVVTAHA